MVVGRAAGIKWLEAREAAKRPTVHRTVSARKNYLAPNVSRAEAEKPCPALTHSSLPSQCSTAGNTLSSMQTTFIRSTLLLDDGLVHRGRDMSALFNSIYTAPSTGLRISQTLNFIKRMSE